MDAQKFDKKIKLSLPHFIHLRWFIYNLSKRFIPFVWPRRRSSFFIYLTVLSVHRYLIPLVHPRSFYFIRASFHTLLLPSDHYFINSILPSHGCCLVSLVFFFSSKLDAKRDRRQNDTCQLISSNSHEILFNESKDRFSLAQAKHLRLWSRRGWKQPYFHRESTSKEYIHHLTTFFYFSLASLLYFRARFAGNSRFPGREILRSSGWLKYRGHCFIRRDSDGGMFYARVGWTLTREEEEKEERSEF